MAEDCEIYMVAIIERPPDWQPTSEFDAPPNGSEASRFIRLSKQTAEEFVREYNRLELKNPTGTWAVLRPDEEAC